MPKRFKPTSSVTVTPEWKTEVQDLLEQMAEARDKAVTANADVAVSQARILQLLEENGQTEIPEFIGESGKRFSGKRVQSVKRTLNRDRFRRKFGPSVLRKVMTSVIDEQKIEGLVKQGQIDEADLATCIDESPNKPYVKVNVR